MSGQLRRLEKKLSFDLEAILPTGDTALHLACHSGQPAMVRLLLEAGALVHSQSLERFTPLHLTALVWARDYCPRSHDEAAARLDCCRLLIEAGADPNARCGRGQTPLHLACHGYHDPTLVYLVEHGADVNAADRDGDTPLHHLFYGGCTLSEGYAILLRAGANPELRNRRNKRLADELDQGEADDDYGDFTDFLPQYQEIRRLLGVNPCV